jgi:hypothetical protein
MIKMARREYMKNYRSNHGDLMKQQTKEWFKNHPDYPTEWREKNRPHYNEYMRQYMRRHRIKNSLVKSGV